MFRYLTKRLLSSVLTLAVFVSLLFFLIQIMMPGDFVSPLRMVMSGAQANALREELGISDPPLDSVRPLVGKDNPW